MNHYFSKVHLCRPPRDRELLRSLSCHGDAYLDHALIWRLFPGDGMTRDFLFRRARKDDGPLSYYVVSKRPPLEVPGLMTTQTKPYAPQLIKGDKLRFDLRANPVITRKAAGSGPSRRHDVLMDAKRHAAESEDPKEAMDTAALEWLLKRAPEWGISIYENSVITSGYMQHRLRHKKRRIEFSSLDYHGLLQVIDPERLTRVLFEGAGHSRGFGCGLLLVKRVG